MPRVVARSVLASQAAMLARIAASEPRGVSRTKIAEAAGVHLTMLPKYEPGTSDPRELTWDQVRRLADAFGWDVTMGAPASAAGYGIAHEAPKPAADPVGAALELVGKSVDLATAVRTALADGVISRDEAIGIAARVSSVVDTAESVGAAASPRLVA